ncbi:MAG TPA: NAD(P)(+) transhydrogenase (Re/Si-specific) subunit beta, partial [Planctomycetaceae bacterium]|nr:NAD(P)(+) transhydrogenase (Re/Si-specific) subunit beta [Planctomycetaceae bacterium]
MVTLGIITGVMLGVFLADHRHASWSSLVVLLNGFAGGAAALLSAALLAEPGVLGSTNGVIQMIVLCALVSAGWLGAFAWGGSVAAASRLQNPHGGWSTGFPGQSLLNLVLVLLSFAIGAWVITAPPAHAAFWGMGATAACSGLLLVTSTRNEELAVLTPWFNACAGMATASVGVALGNVIPMIAGALVATAGLMLTYKFLTHEVLGDSATDSERIHPAATHTTSAVETAAWLKSARRVVVVPGFGMIASHAEEAVRDLVLLLRGQGIEVEVAVHPGGGRVPGQLLEELINVGLPSEFCEEPDEANLALPQTDVALAIGAGDVVNPAARDTAESPLSGGPIIDVCRARRVVMLKRTTQPGFAGIPNALFSADNV